MAPIRPRTRRPHPATATTITPISASPNHQAIPTSTLLAHKSIPSSRAPKKTSKRHSKHNALLSRLHSSTSPSTSRITKRRRPKKKLVTTLTELGDALPDPVSEGHGSEEWQGFGDEKGERRGRIRLKSLKSRPGAMRRREKLERLERERWGRNWNVMATGSTTKGGAGVGRKVEGEKMAREREQDTGIINEGLKNRWAAIRRFVEGNLT